MALHILGTSTWPELPVRPTVLLPVGSMEQHGPHLPLDTDTVVATAVAERLGALLVDSDVVLAAPLAYGASGEHQSFPGTSSIGRDALRFLLVELARSMRCWAARIVIVNGHGGNVAPVVAAVGQLADEGHDVAWVPCAAPGTDAHAGRAETSLMLHLRPERVRIDRCEPGATEPLERILPRLVAEGVGAVSPNGVLGDPRGASADEGEMILARMVSLAEQKLAGRAAPGDRSWPEGMR